MAAGTIKKSKSALFLIELIIAILFFALSSAICVQLFAKAHLISQKSSNVTMAINCAQTAAELVQRYPSGGEALRQGLRASRGQAQVISYNKEDDTFGIKPSGIGDAYEVYYNAEWDALPPGEWMAVPPDARYRMMMALENDEDGMARAVIVVSVIEGDKTLYELHTGAFMKDETKG